MSKMCRALGVPIAWLGDLCTRHPQWLMGKLINRVCNVVCRIHVPLTPSEGPICCFLSLFSLPGLMDGVREKWASLARSCTAGEARYSLTHFYFSLQEKSQAEMISLGTEQCHVGGEDNADKVKLFLLLSLMCPNFYFFFSNGFLKLLHWKAILPQKLFVCE